ncbi:MAG: hypothetical protein SOW59_05505 [Corynebacterium sp.]|nr:hypothetical protein [Corynebacterium sp.]
MEIREQVWSPLQNTAVWLGAWLYHLESTDSLVDALSSLGGQQCVDALSGLAADLVSNYGVGEEPAFIDLLALIRQRTEGVSAADGPVLRLVLHGPGDAAALPVGSAAAAATAVQGEGALVMRTNEDTHLVLVPRRNSARTYWQLFEEHQAFPSPAWLGPGEADLLLSEATNESSTLIETVQTDAPHRIAALRAPCLSVGLLSDFFDSPGLPAVVPARSAKIFARADKVAAIIEAVTGIAQDHTFDYELLRLSRHIRAARTAGVDHALMDFARRCT